jgi:hypothetical protein
MGGPLLGGGLALLPSIPLLGAGAAMIGAVVMIYAISGLRQSRVAVWHSREALGTGNGTPRFRTTTPFASGTLAPIVDGIAVGTVWSNPATGEFEIGFIPGPDEHVSATWQEA